jgi:hypothetical protein
MARFPAREAEIAALAGDIIQGLTQYTEDFPTPPVAAPELQTAVDTYVGPRKRRDRGRDRCGGV